MVVTKGEEKTKAERILEETMAENFSYLMKSTSLFHPLMKNTQEVQWTPQEINSKRSTPTYSIIKLLKDKEKAKILKAARNP